MKKPSFISYVLNEEQLTTARASRLLDWKRQRLEKYTPQGKGFPMSHLPHLCKCLHLTNRRIADLIEGWLAANE
jgi:hypothetical protein